VNEVEAFERLKARLGPLWAELFPHDDAPYTCVVVPSVSIEAVELERHGEALFYEETLLFFLIRLRNPRARVVYVTSEPIPGPILDYYLHFLAGIPASHARARLTTVAAYDRTTRPLAEKILERPRLIQKIRDAIPDPARAYLTVFRSTPLERRLALALDIPLNAADPGMDDIATKSNSRRVFREAGLALPAGAEDLRTQDDLLEALRALRGRNPGLRRAVLKLNRSYWDEGHAIYEFPKNRSKAAGREALRRHYQGLFTTFPHTHLTYYPVEWYMIDEERGWVSCLFYLRMINRRWRSLHRAFPYHKFQSREHRPRVAVPIFNQQMPGGGRQRNSRRSKPSL